MKPIIFFQILNAIYAYDIKIFSLITFLVYFQRKALKR